MASQSHEAIATTAKGVLEHVQLRTQSPQVDEVLVSVEFASLVAFDTWITDSAYFISESSYPLPLGLNAAGTIIAIGPNVDSLQVGDRVSVVILLVHCWNHYTSCHRWPHLRVRMRGEAKQRNRRRCCQSIVLPRFVNLCVYVCKHIVTQNARFQIA